MIASILAVGTELTDGQVVNRNAAWLAARLNDMGFELREHRTVPDNRTRVGDALHELIGESDLVFVTGGLGPTSDDFTREVIAEVLQAPLFPHAEALARVQEKLSSRGVPLSDSHKRQCEFPREAQLIVNPVGTADAFYLRARSGARVFALPGPPAEIAGVWKNGLEEELRRISPGKTEVLHMWRLIGQPESVVADWTEEILRDSGLRIGYRAHVPYVEVKVWVAQKQTENAQEALRLLNEKLSPFTVTRQGEDLVDLLLHFLRRRQETVLFCDEASSGMLAERLIQRRRESEAQDAWPLVVRMNWQGNVAAESSALGKADTGELAEFDHVVVLRADSQRALWQIEHRQAGISTTRELEKPRSSALFSERAGKYLTEQALWWLVRRLQEQRIAQA